MLLEDEKVFPVQSTLQVASKLLEEEKPLAHYSVKSSIQSK